MERKEEPLLLRELEAADLTADSLAYLVRHQLVSRCWRRDAAGEWALRNIAFAEEWDQEEKRRISQALHQTAAGGSPAACSKKG